MTLTELTSLPRTALRTLSRADLKALPQPEPLIDDTVDLRTVALLAGPSGTGKSFLGLDWAACVATGKPWLDRPVSTGRVLYVAAEGAYGLDKRLNTWEYVWQRDTAADERLDFVDRPVNLLDRHAVADLEAHAAGRTLVVVDTLARCMVGADENSARDMGVAVDALYRLRDATGDGTVLAIHHAGKDRTTIRGSSALEAGIDTVYTLEGDGAYTRLTRTKRKDGPVDDQLNLRLDTAVGSAYFVSTQGLDMKPMTRELLSTFMSSFAATGCTKAELRAASGLAPSTFFRAVNDLINSGDLVNNGTEQRPFYKPSKATP